MYGDPTLGGSHALVPRVRRAEEGENLGDSTRGGSGALKVGGGRRGGAWRGDVRYEAAARQAERALELCELMVLEDGAVALRTEMQKLTRNGARTRGLFSITCLIRVLQLLKLLQRFFAVLRRALVLARLMHAAMRDAFAASPNPSNNEVYEIDEVHAVQGCLIFMLAKRFELFGHDQALLDRADRILKFLELDMWCRFTKLNQLRLGALFFPGVDRHMEQLYDVSDLPNIEYVFRDLRLHPGAAFPLFLLGLTHTITKADGNDVYGLVAYAGEVSAAQIELTGQACFAAIGVLRFVALLERMHGRQDARLFEGENEDVHFVDFGRRGRAPGIRRRGSTLGPSLGLRGSDGPWSDTLGGCPLLRARPHPDNPAFRRLCAAGVGPYGVLPLHDRAVVADVFAVLNTRGQPLGTMVAGQREPAEILARGPAAYFAPVYDVRVPAS